MTVGVSAGRLVFDAELAILIVETRPAAGERGCSRARRLDVNQHEA